MKFKTFHNNQQNPVVYIRANACTSRDYTKNITGVCFVGQDITSEKIVMDKFIRLQGDYNAIIQSLSPLIPPIFASDENGCCSEWNVAMEKLTGLVRDEVIGKTLPGEVFGGYCQLKGLETLTKFRILLYQAIFGQETDRFHFGFFDRKGILVEVVVTANKRTDSCGTVIGCFCFLQILKPVVQTDYKGESSKLKELAYIHQEMKTAFNGIRFTHQLLERTVVSENQKQVLETSDACERQIMAIMDNMDIASIEEG